MPKHTPDKLDQMIAAALKRRAKLWARFKRTFRAIEDIDEDVRRWEKAKKDKETEALFKRSLNIDQDKEESR